MTEGVKKRIIDAVCGEDVENLRALLAEYPDLATHINDPVFPFGSYAVFQCRANIEMVDLLLEHGADLNLKTDWWAGGFGILEGVDRAVAEPLIERGAIVDIWAAVGLDDLERVNALLDEDPDRVVARGGDGKHPIHYAASVEMVDLLVRRGADVSARDIDHQSTPAQYLVRNETVVRRLLHHGASPDIFLAAALGDVKIARACIQADPSCTEVRLGEGNWTDDAGGHIYGWTLGHNVTPQIVARDRGHDEVLQLLLERSSPERRLAHAVWYADVDNVYAMIRSQPESVDRLLEAEPRLMTIAAWWYRPEAVGILLELGFDPHLTGVHESTPLDRAAFHGYADIIELLIEGDPDPPVAHLNEFGGTPLGACVHGSVHGWKTGHPQDHVRSVRLLIEAGCSFSSDWLPTGNSDIDEVLKEYLLAEEP